MATDREILETFYSSVSWADALQETEWSNRMLALSEKVVFIPINYQDSKQETIDHILGIVGGINSWELAQNRKLWFIVHGEMENDVAEGLYHWSIPFEQLVLSFTNIKAELVKNRFLSGILDGVDIAESLKAGKIKFQWE